MDTNSSKDIPDLIFGDFIIKIDESQLLLPKPTFLIDENIYKNKFNKSTEYPWMQRSCKKKYYCSDYESSDSYDSDY